MKKEVNCIWFVAIEGGLCGWDHAPDGHSLVMCSPCGCKQQERRLSSDDYQKKGE